MKQTWEEFKEHSVRSGIGTALCVMLPSETKYHILSAVESLPPVFGSPNSIEYSTTTNWSITNVRGKNTTENVEINIPYNLDNIALCEKIKGVLCKYAYIDLDDFSGQEFIAEASYHLAEVGTDSIKTIVLTLTVSSAEEGITEDLYDLFQNTIQFDDNVPSVVRVSLSTDSAGKTFKIATNPTSATISANADSSGVIDTASLYTSGTLKIKPTAKGSTIITIEATANDYASNSRKIKVIVVD